MKVKQVSNQLRVTVRKLASQSRFERLTYALGGRRSIQLSYWDVKERICSASILAVVGAVAKSIYFFVCICV